MSWSLGQAVESGEIVNTTVNQVHGWLRLRGQRRPLYLHLTGNASPSLAGRRVTFEARGASDARLCGAESLARQQIGPVGELHLPDASESCELRIEWFGQNGQVRCAIGKITSLQVSEPVAQPAAEDLVHPGPHGVFARLPSLRNLQSASTRPADGDWEQRFQVIDAMMSDESRDVSIRSQLPASLELPDVAELSSQDLYFKLKETLAHLAVLGISLDMCHHFSGREAYQLIIERLLPKETMHPDLPRSGYVMHYLTFEYCRQCIEEEESWVLDEVIEEEQARGK